jgi:glycine cleavage system regulatory protein
VNQQIVMTVLGPDRPGIVEILAEVVRKHQGSWQESRLSHLQDQFAGIIELRLPTDQLSDFQGAVDELKSSWDLQCQFSIVEATKQEGALVCLECIGQDRPGIVFAISDVFHDLHINVESMDSSLQSAPMSGEMLFCSSFAVRLPENIDLDLLDDRLAAISEELMLDVTIGDE